MKKLFLILLLAVIFIGEGNSQSKVNFILENPRLSGGFWQFDLKATIPAGQFWRPGACNIRINFTTVPAGILTVKADNPMINANPNISNANGYNAMTTTSFLSGTVLSVNILTFNTSGFYRFNPGTYLLGTVRWTPSGPFTNSAMTFRVPPTASPTLITDSTIFLVSGTSFGTTNPLVTGSNTISSEIPTEFKLYENYPNPFNPSTSIQYDIPANSFVKLVVYDITGKEVTTLVNETMPAGKYEAVWNGKEFASGVYFARIEAGSYKHIIKMLMVK
jgi:hypothetical protein